MIFVKMYKGLSPIKRQMWLFTLLSKVSVENSGLVSPCL